MSIPPETSVSIAVRAYTMIGPGENVIVENFTESIRELCIHLTYIIDMRLRCCVMYRVNYLFILVNFTAIVSGLSATSLNSTSVRVSWTPVNLTVVYHYTVHYTTVGGVSGTVTFPDTVSSGVVSGLQGGQQYQFSVTVTLNISGELYTGAPDYTLPPITGKKTHAKSTVATILVAKQLHR